MDRHRKLLHTLLTCPRRLQKRISEQLRNLKLQWDQQRAASLRKSRSQSKSEKQRRARYQLRISSETAAPNLRLTKMQKVVREETLQRASSFSKVTPTSRTLFRRVHGDLPKLLNGSEVHDLLRLPCLTETFIEILLLILLSQTPNFWEKAKAAPWLQHLSSFTRQLPLKCLYHLPILPRQQPPLKCLYHMPILPRQQPHHPAKTSMQSPVDLSLDHIAVEKHYLATVTAQCAIQAHQ